MALPYIDEQERRKNDEQVFNVPTNSQSATAPVAGQHPSGKSLIDIWDENGVRPNFIRSFNQPQPSTQPQPATQAQQAPVGTALRMYQDGAALADQEVDKYRAQAAQAIEDYNRLYKELRSSYQAVGKVINPSSDPKFAEDATKRERNKAIAVALGNLFSNLAGGIMAASGKGLGYVPTATPNKSLAKLSELETEWLKRSEEFKVWNANQSVREKEAKVKAAGDTVKTANDNLAAAEKTRQKAAERVAAEQSKIDADNRRFQEQKRKELAALEAKKQAIGLTYAEKAEYARLMSELKIEQDNNRSANRIEENNAKSSNKGSGTKGTSKEEAAPAKPSAVRTARAPKKQRDAVAAAGLDIEQ